jgi:hypothetical protein
MAPRIMKIVHDKFKNGIYGEDNITVLDGKSGFYCIYIIK